jgi:ubiquinone/menaquinone biosynthesis C-methylase UbiE
MNKPVDTRAAPGIATSTPQLLDTKAAFDSVAADYDGPRGNNDLIQDMRREMWRWLEAIFSPGARLLDLGCGTGLDAVHLARQGYRVAATDWSPHKVERNTERAAAQQVTDRVRAMNVGAHELHRLQDACSFDGAYSNLGPLNCVPEIADVARECARLLKPGGALVFTVIGRFCPWEIAHYVRRGRWSRAKVRFARNIVPVGMNNHTIWTRYYTPREFYKPFEQYFSLQHFRGLCVFAPPPYLTAVRDKHPRLHAQLWELDRKVAGWPLIRAMGDHFLVVMRKR